ncbi:MAG: MFS transporter [Gammaproteobacteria bacterium]
MTRSANRLATLSWAHFLNDGAANYLPGVLPAVLLALHAPVALAGSIMGTLLLGQALQPLYGWLSDHLGGRRLIFIGITGTTLGGAAVGIAPGYGGLLVVLLVIGLTNSMFHPQALAAVRGLSSGRDGFYMSVFLVGGELGRGIWPVLASLVVAHLGLASLWILALPALLTLPWLHHRVPRLAARHPDSPPIAWRRHRRALTNVVVYCALRATMMFSLVTFVPLIWHQQGGSLITGASLISTLLVTGIIGNVGGGHLADRFGRRPILFAASMLSAALLALFLVVSGPWLWLVLGLLGIALFATVPLSILMGQDILPENRSLGAGLALGLANGIGALAVMALGALTVYWSPATVLWLNVGLGLIAMLQVPFLPEKPQPGDTTAKRRPADGRLTANLGEEGNNLGSAKTTTGKGAGDK